MKYYAASVAALLLLSILPLQVSVPSAQRAALHLWRLSRRPPARVK